MPLLAAGRSMRAAGTSSRRRTEMAGNLNVVYVVDTGDSQDRRAAGGRRALGNVGRGAARGRGRQSRAADRRGAAAPVRAVGQLRALRLVDLGRVRRDAHDRPEAPAPDLRKSTTAARPSTACPWTTSSSRFRSSAVKGQNEEFLRTKVARDFQTADNPVSPELFVERDGELVLLQVSVRRLGGARGRRPWRAARRRPAQGVRQPRRPPAPGGEPGAPGGLRLGRGGGARRAGGVGGAVHPARRGARRRQGARRGSRRRRRGQTPCAPASPRFPEDAAVIVVHDAARPLLPEAVLERVVTALADGWDGAVPGAAARRHRQAGRGRSRRGRRSTGPGSTPSRHRRRSSPTDCEARLPAAPTPPTAPASSRPPAAGSGSSRATAGSSR